GPSDGFPLFRDVAGGALERAVEDLWLKGVTNGCTPDSYCPTSSVNRGQMASFLVRAFDLPAAGSSHDFADSRGNAHAESIRALAAAGITVGCTEDRYCPTAPVTRGQMASFLARAMGQSGGPPHGYPDVTVSAHDDG